MTSVAEVNQLALLVVSGRQAGELMQQLTRNGFYYTIIDSSGGVLQEPTTCLLVGLDYSRTRSLLSLVRTYCQTQTEYIPAQVNIPPGLPNFQMIEAQVGGALVYTMDVERFEQY